MAFDIGKMTTFSVSAIKAFAESHKRETFYAFAIDSNMLCLNSEECAEATLKRYREQWERSTREIRSWDQMTEVDKKDEKLSLEIEAKHNGLNLRDTDACIGFINRIRAPRRERGCIYNSAEGIRMLRENTGDWEYQGFAQFGDEHGFDHALYSVHYEAAAKSNDGHAPSTVYAKAMSTLIESLISVDAFACLCRGVDFRASWVDHD